MLSNWRVANGAALVCPQAFECTAGTNGARGKLSGSSSMQPDDPLERALHAAEPILFRKALPSPTELIAQLTAAAEAGDVKAAYFLLTFVPWARSIF